MLKTVKFSLTFYKRYCCTFMYVRVGERYKLGGNAPPAPLKSTYAILAGLQISLRRNSQKVMFTKCNRKVSEKLAVALTHITNMMKSKQSKYVQYQYHL